MDQVTSFQEAMSAVQKIHELHMIDKEAFDKMATKFEGALQSVLDHDWDFTSPEEDKRVISEIIKKALKG